MNDQAAQRDDRGFTLIELVIAIAVVGILSAVAIVGLAGLLGKSRTASCDATADSSSAAAAVHVANFSNYPGNFTQMISAGELALPRGVTDGGSTLNGKGWTLTFNAPVGNAPPTFTGCP
jgi:prepilin-type N-terminal cleavage/methylation domain-containing protein